MKRTTRQQRFQKLALCTVTLGLALAALPFGASAQQRVEDRLSRIERILDSGALTDMANQQEQLRRGLQELQGEVELMRRELSELRQRQHDLYLDTDRRLQQLEARAAQPPALPPESGSSASEGEATAAAPSSQADELTAYQAAFDALKDGRYAEATTSFQAFLQQFPQGQYAANALYWLAESYYVVRDFPNAMSQFQRVLDEHPASSKSPDALLKIGFVHYEQGEMAKARQVLEKVKADYPNTTAAALAEQRLLRLPAR